MFAIERRQAIANLINEKGNVTIFDLTALFGVSSETIRKDLLILEKDRVLIRTHGGAINAKTHSKIAPFKERLKSNAKGKAELCRYAAKHIKNGDTISIDAGSTAIELAKLISSMFSRLTVVTHCLDVFNILSKNDGIDLVLCGGDFNREENTFMGNITAEAVEKIHTEKAFIFPSGVSLKFGVTDYDGGFLRIQKAMMDNADKVFVLADSDKYEKAAYTKLCSVTQEYTYITDSALSQEIYDLYRKNEINIVAGKEK